ERPSSAGGRQVAPLASTTSARARVAAQALADAPAFLRTPPPTLHARAHPAPPAPSPAATMKPARIRCPAPRDEERAANLRRGQLPAKFQDERVDALVGHEQIRAQPDDRNRKVVPPRPGQRLLDLLERRRFRQCLRRPPGSERRVAADRNRRFDLQPSASRMRSAARSTSPAPRVSTRSPARACAATKRAASSTL